jgi:hypothetical protein
MLREGREWLAARAHPDMYIQVLLKYHTFNLRKLFVVMKAYMPGGTLFMRNPPTPLEVVYPNGIPEGMRK